MQKQTNYPRLTFAFGVELIKGESLPNSEGFFFLSDFTIALDVNYLGTTFASIILHTSLHSCSC